MGDISNVFIVGNARSGTTMMMRIMNNHPMVHSINEPHFFGTHWAPSDDGKPLEREEAALLMAKMIARQREDFFAEVVPGRYDAEIAGVLDALGAKLDRISIYKAFLAHETSINGRSVACEKTPQNIFYIDEIQRYFPGSKVIVLYRDPRAVLLSQKRKWMRQGLGNSKMPDKEVRRLRMNYHPFTISRLWNSSFRAAQRYKDDPDVIHVRFEDLTSQPTETLQRICSIIGIPYDEVMQRVPHAGSSSERDDPSKLGVRSDRTGKWKGELSDAEIAICQRTCAEYMAKTGYAPVEVDPTTWELATTWSTFPFKLIVSFMMNLGRMRNIKDTLQRRFLKA